MQKLRSTLVALGIASFLSSGIASANSTVEATLGDTTTGLAPGTDNAVKVTFTNGTLSDAYVGQINWFNTTVVSDASYPDNGSLTQVLGGGQSFSTYCIEGTEDVYFGGTAHWDGVVGLTSAPETNPSITNTYLTSAQISDLTKFWNKNYDSIGIGTTQQKNDNATAFQLGIWEIVSADNVGGIATDSNFLTSGKFQAANDSDTVAVGIANGWLTSLAGQTDTQEYSLYALVAYGTQDQIFAVKNPNGGSGNVVPLPAALPAGLSLLGGLALLNIRRRLRAN